MLPVKSELEARGEGGQLVHGRATLRPPANRADLFSPDLDLKLSSVQCSLCREESASLGDWREHCSTQHPAHPGFSPSTLHCGLPSHPALFSASLQRPFACPACSRCFSSAVEAEDHQHSQTRCVRLVCGQCDTQWPDLETHILSHHREDTVCQQCGQPDLPDLLEHYHTTHDGFASVVAETETKCTGDGINVEWFETVLSTDARFLATEVKPESGTDLAEPAGLVIVSVSGSSGSSGAGRAASEIMTDEERQAYNVQAYNKFREAGAGLNRNECELCGFVPYTKNKYREKQDHLAKFHFKERIDAVLPTGRPYACPADECEYLGKDKQDILRHYTGKHNILKMWVEAFMWEQSEAAAGQASRWTDQTGKVTGVGKKPESSLTFQQMEVQAIQSEHEKQREEEEVTSLPGGLSLTRIRRGSADPPAPTRAPLFVSRTREEGGAGAAELLAQVAARVARHPCSHCHMVFPSQQAAALHMTVCRAAELGSPASPQQPSRKKARRPPPPLIPL